jgi:heterotetrameric sarcosine oxidase gamma subunit
MAKAASTKAASSAVAARDAALAGQKFSASGVTLAVLPPAERISLRAPAASVGVLSEALGVSLPLKPKSATTKAGRTALWLGPDEWLVIDEAGKDPLADCARVTALHSAVGISHRNVAIAVTGPAAAVTINAGCPQDLSLAAFPAGACSRTILGKVEIVLMRTADDAFRVECWRSFSDYVWAFLTEAARDAAA